MVDTLYETFCVLYALKRNKIQGGQVSKEGTNFKLQFSKYLGMILQADCR